jgi:ferritin-like metal-binding protein YciE
MKLELLEDFYVEELKDLYSAEKQILKALPEMAKAASSEELRLGFEQHERETRGQKERLEQLFGKLGEPAKPKKCKAMAGLIAEAKEFLAEDAEPEVRDVGLITCAQKIEHYEIAGYGSAREHANVLGFEDQAALLQQTLNEEENTDEKLTLLARSINVDAAEDEAVTTVVIGE